jgi:thymidine phosphorylase
VVFPDRAGIVQGIDTRAIGIAIIELGGGRMRASDAIDAAVGFSQLAGLGTKVDGRPIARLHARDEESAERAAVGLRRAYQLANDSHEKESAIVGRISVSA